MKQYYVYILASHSKVLYVGITNDLKKRIYQHKAKLVEGFTAQYTTNSLVYFEETPNVSSAIEREKELKGWVQNKKIALIEIDNPNWQDLGAGWDA